MPKKKIGGGSRRGGLEGIRKNSSVVAGREVPPQSAQRGLLIAVRS